MAALTAAGAVAAPLAKKAGARLLRGHEYAMTRLYEQAQEIIYDDAPWVPVAYARVPLGYQSNVDGIVPNPTGGESFNDVQLGA